MRLDVYLVLAGSGQLIQEGSEGRAAARSNVGCPVIIEPNHLAIGWLAGGVCSRQVFNLVDTIIRLSVDRHLFSVVIVCTLDRASHAVYEDKYLGSRRGRATGIWRPSRVVPTQWTG